MTNKTVSIFGLFLVAGVAAAQQSDILVKLTGGDRPAIAIPDLRGSGDAQTFMGRFNQTLWDDVQASGLFKMAPKSMYPLQTPQQPRDFRAPLAAPARPARLGAPPPKPVRQGPWLDDWSGPPVGANYLAFGYAAVQGGQLVLFGYLYDVTQADVSSAQVIGKLYSGSLDEAGARKVAQEFAADILARFGGKSLMGSKIYFVSNRSGNKEIWSMDYDGSNQKQLTFYKTISSFPAVSPDGTKFAFTSYLRGNPSILIHSVETGRDLRFYNQAASMNAASDFTPDGRQLLLFSTAGNLRYAQLFIANVDGTNFRRLSNSQAIEVEPKVNPKTGREIVFVSGRSGMP
ncbi:MAG: PD40 domain-containing protein, partial [Acidobacteria bacterium]|nr:PD40 domain-containing protein [Acidobacteriota bacterium]